MTLTRIDKARLREFLLTNTVLMRPTHVPELTLHLAKDMTTLWQRATDQLGEPHTEPPYWASAWAGGQAVARHLLDTPGVAARKRVLDLASGSGLCAIAALKAGAVSAVCADIDPLSAIAVVENALLNDVTVTPLTEDLLDSAPPAVDLIVAGDVCYEREMADRMLTWLRTCQATGIAVFLGDPGRDYLPSSGLREVARFDIDADPPLENLNIRQASVYTLD